jgi:hypothetical protein
MGCPLRIKAETLGSADPSLYVAVVLDGDDLAHDGVFSLKVS